MGIPMLSCCHWQGQTAHPTAQRAGGRAMNTYELFNIIFQVTKFVVEVILKIFELRKKKRE